MSDDLDDIELLMRWRDGDDEAGNRLTRRSFRLVFRFFDNKASRHALDLTQQTFLELVESRARMVPHTSFRAYLLGIARYKLIAHLRQYYRSDGVFSPERSSALLAHPDPGSSPTHRLAQHEQHDVVDIALRRLPLDHQIALEMHYWNEMSIAEIAAVLDCTPGSIKARLFRARKGLQQQVKSLLAHPDPLLARLDEELSSLDPSR